MILIGKRGLKESGGDFIWEGKEFFSAGWDRAQKDRGFERKERGVPINHIRKGAH